MAQRIAGKFPLRDGPPPDWHEEAVANFELQYVMDEGKFDYYYKQGTTPSAKARALVEIVPILAWSGPIPEGDVYQNLNIYIWQDTSVYIRTSASMAEYPLYWSTAEDAIKTEDNHDDLYGELLYETPEGKWVKRVDYPHNTRCSRIWFKAKHKTHAKSGHHRFSLYVVADGVEREIDPDIRNPPVTEP